MHIFDIICATFLTLATLLGFVQFLYLTFGQSYLAKTMRSAATALPYRYNVVLSLAGAGVALLIGLFTSWINMPYTTTILVAAAILTPPCLVFVYLLYRKVEQEERLESAC